MSGDDPPLVAGVIHGVREWRIDWSGGSARLGAAFVGTVWEQDGEPTQARCEGGGNAGRGHRAPRGDCVCGLYALHPRTSAAARLGPGALDDDEPLVNVAGVVEAWGRVEVHEDGFRAEYARPIALAVIGAPPGSDTALIVERLAERYRAEVVHLGNVGALIDHCRERQLGLGEPVVRSLLNRPDPIPIDEPETPAPPPVAAPWRPRRNPIRDMLSNALVVLVGIVWYGFLAAIAVIFVIGLIEGLKEEPAATSRDLRLVEQRLVRVQGELRYVAVVENTSREEAALRVLPRGRFLDLGGARLAGVDRPRDIDLRPSLGPGEKGVVVDRIGPAPGVDPDEVEGYEIELVARRKTMPADAPAQPSFHRVELDRDRCRLSAIVRAPDAPGRPRVVALVRDRTGEISSGGHLRTGPIPAGRSHQVLVRNGRPCPRFVHEVEVFASPTPEELLGESPG